VDGRELRQREVHHGAGLLRNDPHLRSEHRDRCLRRRGRHVGVLEFSGTPTSNTSPPGTTKTSSFQSSSLVAPTGLVSVAKVTFDAVAAATTSVSIDLTVRYLYDTNSDLILPATGMGAPWR